MCITGPSTVSQGAGTGQDCRQALGQPLPNYAWAESLQNHRTLLQSSSKSLLHLLSIFGLDQVLLGINLIDIFWNTQFMSVIQEVLAIQTTLLRWPFDYQTLNYRSSDTTQVLNTWNPETSEYQTFWSYNIWCVTWFD